MTEFMTGTESAILMTESESESLSEETTIPSGEEGGDDGEFNSVEAVEDTSPVYFYSKRECNSNISRLQPSNW